MAVHRTAVAGFDTSKSSLVEHTREVLNGDPTYKNTVEDQNGEVFTTNVKPGWWLSGTKMVVQIGGTDSNATAKVSLVPQRFIMGDIFDYYNRYI